MPWKESTKVEERVKFVLLALEPGANLSQLCRDFCIDRKTGRKWRQRYLESGMAGLYDLSRTPKRWRDSTPPHVVCEIVKIRKHYKKRGPLRIQRMLRTRFAEHEVPSERTIARILERSGYGKPKRRAIKKKKRSELLSSKHCNHLWTADHKGWWTTQDGKRVEPLLIRDDYSRFLLDLGACSNTATKPAKQRFQIAFERYGLPEYIRTDNGAPFASVQGLFGLSSLSVWWMKLGITPEFISPGKPWQNGAHERVNRNISEELEANPAQNNRNQQELFDIWRMDFNFEPHSALGEASPSSVYRSSSRSYDPREPEFDYSSQMIVRKVEDNGMMTFKNQRYKFSKAFGGERVAFEQTDESQYKVRFCEYTLGTVELKQYPATRTYPVRHFNWIELRKIGEDLLA